MDQPSFQVQRTIPPTPGISPKLMSPRAKTDLYLRKVVHPQALDNYRIILKYDGLEVEVGSIGIQHVSGATEAWTT